MSEIYKYIERLEQKRKIHDMSAKVVLEIQSLEDQQEDIIKCTKNNQKLFEFLQGGMKDNIQTIKKNLEYLKNKASTNK